MIQTAQLKKNLRRNVLRGQPWIFKDSLKPFSASSPGLALLKDIKAQHLAWGIIDPQSALAFRVLSTEKVRPDETWFRKIFDRVLNYKRRIVESRTNCYRLFNGEGDRLPGLVCDIYDQTAVLQFDGQNLEQFWLDRTPLRSWAEEHYASLMVKPRAGGDDKTPKFLTGAPKSSIILAQEAGRLYNVDIVRGQKTGFFLDQRENRSYVQSISARAKVLNLFAYTGGFSIAAGLGGAKSVMSVDLSEAALKQADENWILNDLDSNKHKTLAIDLLSDSALELSEEFDLVIVDPPSMAKSQNQKATAILKYNQVFAAAAKLVKPGGDLCLSSCSSRISFSDFEEIIAESLSKARRKGVICRWSGQACDHPYPHVTPELRYLKFAHLVLD